jgi:hypothetical protein
MNPSTDGSANSRQVGGNHYRTEHGIQHWDLVAMFQWDYFQGQIIKYLMRWKKKGGVQDLEKARHYLDKYIEVERCRDGKSAVTAATADGSNPVWHKEDTSPGMALCAADYAGMYLTNDYRKVTCPECLLK